MPVIQQLTVIGVGLIGGSLARALRRANFCQRVVGCGRSESELNKAVALDVIDHYELDIANAVTNADIVVLAVPLGAMENVLRNMVGHLKPSAVVTDVGSAKESVVLAARRAFGAVPNQFVPGHPIAGTENSGVEASFAELFQQRRVILTPLPETDATATALVRKMWSATGATVDEMSVAQHDAMLAATSHLPHLLAYTLVDTLLQADSSEQIFRFAAGGFRDFTRIASSDPVMWRDICLANREAIVAMLERFRQQLDVVQNAIEQGDGFSLKEMFVRAKSARDRNLRTLQ